MRGQRHRVGSSGHRQRRSRSRTSIYGLSFTARDMESLLRDGHYTQHLSSSAPIFLMAIIEYITAKVLELAGREARNRGQSRITPESLDMAIHNNLQLRAFFWNTTICQVLTHQE
ncbi:PREDICTED: histone H2A-Bbd type 2/3-like [Hipposideros armiger]|uniref:Histone H2A n=1 Tax=Hipposideros armiger TaxID=186990 RepID=A0A8B7Q5J9_HIPAR|nr:PREDICTED: histone H2A-Bbd type 2/3-like [Hipposideros armiger]